MMPFAEQRAQDPRMLHYVESLRKIQRKIGERLFARCQANMERTAQDAIKLQLACRNGEHGATTSSLLAFSLIIVPHRN